LSISRQNLLALFFVELLFEGWNGVAEPPIERVEVSLVSDAVVLSDDPLPKWRVGCSEFYPIMMTMLVEKFDEARTLPIRENPVIRGCDEEGGEDDGKDVIQYLEIKRAGRYAVDGELFFHEVIEGN